MFDDIFNTDRRNPFDPPLSDPTARTSTMREEMKQKKAINNAKRALANSLLQLMADNCKDPVERTQIQVMLARSKIHSQLDTMARFADSHADPESSAAALTALEEANNILSTFLCTHEVPKNTIFD